MNKKLTLALAATAIAATSSTFITTAEAGGRGGHRFHFRLHQFHQQQHAYRSEESYVVRRKRKVVVKQVVKYVEKPAPARRLVAKYSDGQGRQFDPPARCGSTARASAGRATRRSSFKSGSWFYGDARWIETSSGWGVSTGGLPQQVSCDGIKAFSAKIEQAKAKPAKTVVEPKVEKVEQAELKTEPVAEAGAKVVTSTPRRPPRPRSARSTSRASARWCRCPAPSEQQRRGAQALKSELGESVMRVPANTATIAQPGIPAGRTIPAGRMGKAMPMVPKLAYRNLFHDRLSLVVTLVGIVFSVVLVAVQFGIYLGSENRIAAMLDQAKGDLWVVALGTKSFDDPSLLSGRERHAVLSTPGVGSVEELAVGFVNWRKPKGGSTAALLVGSEITPRQLPAVERHARQRQRTRARRRRWRSTAPISASLASASSVTAPRSTTWR